jgi:hypothetical protein
MGIEIVYAVVAPIVCSGLVIALVFLRIQKRQKER